MIIGCAQPRPRQRFGLLDEEADLAWREDVRQESPAGSGRHYRPIGDEVVRILSALEQAELPDHA